MAEKTLGYVVVQLIGDRCKVVDWQIDEATARAVLKKWQRDAEQYPASFSGHTHTVARVTELEAK
jgi:hypothetical protein